jgi:hypothetical protein
MRVMVLSCRGLALLACSAVAILAPPARVRADSAGPAPMCRVVSVEFTPGGFAAGTEIRDHNPDPEKELRWTVPETPPQIVAWVEKPTGEYVQTLFITQNTGRYGMANRPGRFDFNSGPAWPYGRRTTVFPVWSHKHGLSFPQVEFQTGGDDKDSNLSHELTRSSREPYYCRPLLKIETQWDTATCASAVFTDKGVFGARTSSYPPRSDLNPVLGTDSPSVQMYRSMNPFDAVSQATPRLGSFASLSSPTPDLSAGDYVLFVEVALEQDFNDAFNGPKYPSPSVTYGEYGVAYRGQPSVIYRVPFVVMDGVTIATTDTYAGYGDPDGLDGKIRPPDPTKITADVPNTGASRLLLTSRDGQMFRVRVDARSEQDKVSPAPPGNMVITDAESSSATLTFVAPGDDDMLGTVSGYESASELQFSGDIVASGQPQLLAVKNLLPETEYTVAVRAFDNCHNTSRVTSATFTTAPRPVGSVDACFIATAAYGSIMANDVEMLRRFRDMLLRKSVLGELAVEAYYTFGPPVASVVGESDLLRTTARDVLTPIVGWARGLRW